MVLSEQKEFVHNKCLSIFLSLFIFENYYNFITFLSFQIIFKILYGKYKITFIISTYSSRWGYPALFSEYRRFSFALTYMWFHNESSNDRIIIYRFWDLHISWPLRGKKGKTSPISVHEWKSFISITKHNIPTQISPTKLY